MDELNDEILNMYLDNELDNDSMIKVEKAINNSEDLRKRYHALKTVHRNLLKMNADETSPDFVNKVMSRLNKNAYLFKQQNYFLAAMYLIFLGGSVLLIGYIMYGMFSAGAEANSTKKIVNDTMIQIENASMLIKNFFNNTNISMIGTILSFLIIISGYSFFEFFKNNKTNLNKI